MIDHKNFLQQFDEVYFLRNMVFILCQKIRETDLSRLLHATIWRIILFSFILRLPVREYSTINSFITQAYCFQEFDRGF